MALDPKNDSILGWMIPFSGVRNWILGQPTEAKSSQIRIVNFSGMSQWVRSRLISSKSPQNWGCSMQYLMVNTCKEGLSRGNRCKMTKVLQADESTQSPCSRLFHIFMDYKLWSIPSCPFAFRNVTIVSYLFQLSIFSFISHILGHSYIPVLYYNYINFIYRYKNSILFVHEASPLDLAF